MVVETSSTPVITEQVAEASQWNNLPDTVAKDPRTQVAIAILKKYERKLIKLYKTVRAGATTSTLIASYRLGKKAVIIVPTNRIAEDTIISDINRMFKDEKKVPKIVQVHANKKCIIKRMEFKEYPDLADLEFIMRPQYCEPLGLYKDFIQDCNNQDGQEDEDNKRKLNIDKLAKLIINDDIKRTLRAWDYLDLGAGYSLKMDKAELKLFNNGKFVTELKLSTDITNNTWTYLRDNISSVDKVPVLKVHINSVKNEMGGLVVNIDGIWALDYDHIQELKEGDELLDNYVLKSVSDESLFFNWKDEAGKINDIIFEIQETDHLSKYCEIADDRLRTALRRLDKEELSVSIERAHYRSPAWFNQLYPVIYLFNEAYVPIFSNHNGCLHYDICPYTQIFREGNEADIIAITYDKLVAVMLGYVAVKEKEANRKTKKSISETDDPNFFADAEIEDPSIAEEILGILSQVNVFVIDECHWIETVSPKFLESLYYKVGGGGAKDVLRLKKYGKLVNDLVTEKIKYYQKGADDTFVLDPNGKKIKVEDEKTFSKYRTLSEVVQATSQIVDRQEASRHKDRALKKLQAENYPEQHTLSTFVNPLDTKYKKKSAKAVSSEAEKMIKTGDIQKYELGVDDLNKAFQMCEIYNGDTVAVSGIRSNDEMTVHVHSYNRVKLAMLNEFFRYVQCLGSTNVFGISKISPSF